MLYTAFKGRAVDAGIRRIGSPATALPSPAPPIPVAAAACIVLCRSVTGLATVRALGRMGVDVHAFVLDASDPVRWSRYAKAFDATDCANDEARLLATLIGYARRVGGRPVLIPTGDALALMLCEHRDSLAPVARVWSTDRADLREIVCKEDLYRRAIEAGVSTIPSIWNASANEVLAWADEFPGPYLLKPSYEAVSQSSVRGKNLTLPNRAELFKFIQQRGMNNAVVQQLVSGGDGEIYDTYGLCDADGRVVVLASHRRLRQYPPNFGTTCLGAIPSGRDDDEQALFEPTRRLLGCWRYHGIFGIEWLRDRQTGQFSVIDFNARPFSSIGHLCDSGLNLPWLAWRELQGDPLSNQPPTPTLSASLWVDSVRDLATFRQTGRGGIGRWWRDVREVDFHAYSSMSDVKPTLRHSLTVARVLATAATRPLRERLRDQLPNLFGGDRRRHRP